MQVLPGADVVTMVYGMSELYDVDRTLASNAIAKVFTLLQSHAGFLLVDPVSLQLNNEKCAWFDAMAAKGCCTVAVGMEAKMHLSATLIDSSPLKQWHKTFAMRVGHDVKVFAKCWCRVYVVPLLTKETATANPATADGRTGYRAAGVGGGGGSVCGIGAGGSCGAALIAGEGAASSASQSKPELLRMKRTADGGLKKASADVPRALDDHCGSVTRSMDASKAVLVVVPDAAVDYWLEGWGSAPVFRITGSDGGDAAAVWARVAREVARWTSTPSISTPPADTSSSRSRSIDTGGGSGGGGAVLLIDYGRVVHLLSASVTPPNHTAVNAQTLLRSPGCLIVDEMQLALAQVRRQSKAKVKVVDALKTVQSQKKTILIANVVNLDGDDSDGGSPSAHRVDGSLKGTASESAEDAHAWPLVIAAAEQLHPVRGKGNAAEPAEPSERLQCKLCAQ